MTAHSPPQGPGDLDLPESRRTRLEGRPDRTPPTGGEGAFLCGAEAVAVRGGAYRTLHYASAIPRLPTSRRLSACIVNRGVSA